MHASIENSLEKVHNLYNLEEGSAGKILSGNLGMYKGAIYENVIADLFAKHNINLFYYSKDSGLEIDFVSIYKDEIVLIEAKATNGNTKSTNTILKNKNKYNVNLSIKLGECNVGFDNNKLSIPFYMGILLF